MLHLRKGGTDWTVPGLLAVGLLYAPRTRRTLARRPGLSGDTPRWLDGSDFCQHGRVPNRANRRDAVAGDEHRGQLGPGRGRLRSPCLRRIRMGSRGLGGDPAGREIRGGDDFCSRLP